MAEYIHTMVRSRSAACLLVFRFVAKFYRIYFFEDKGYRMVSFASMHASTAFFFVSTSIDKSQPVSNEHFSKASSTKYRACEHLQKYPSTRKRAHTKILYAFRAVMRALQ